MESNTSSSDNTKVDEDNKESEYTNIFVTARRASL